MSIHFRDLTETQARLMDSLLEGEELGYPLMLHMNAASISKALGIINELMSLGLVEAVDDPGEGSVPLMWHRLTSEGRRVRAERSS